MKKKTAIIIKGNSKYIKDNFLADEFYLQLKEFLESLHFEVQFDEGKPYTLPPIADVWIGHSRGADRLRFADQRIQTIALGSSYPGSLNHPLDNANKIQVKPPLNFIPNRFHYILNEEMKTELQKRLN